MKWKLYILGVIAAIIAAIKIKQYFEPKDPIFSWDFTDPKFEITLTEFQVHYIATQIWAELSVNGSNVSYVIDLIESECNTIDDYFYVFQVFGEKPRGWILSGGQPDNIDVWVGLATDYDLAQYIRKEASEEEYNRFKTILAQLAGGSVVFNE